MDVERIYPLTQSACTPYIGRTVCAVMKDGTHVVGTIKEVNEHGLVLSKEKPGVHILSTAGGRLRKKRRKANTSAFGFGGPFGPGGYPYNDFLLSWSLIALLFLVPFFYF